MARTTVASLSARMDASEARMDARFDALTSTVDVLAQSVAALTAHLSAPVTPEEPAKAKKPAARKAAPAKTAPAKKETSEFYTQVIVGKREAREARKAFNPKAAAWMREKGLVPSGSAWAAVKAGERNVRTLKALNRKDGLA